MPKRAETVEKILRSRCSVEGVWSVGNKFGRKSVPDVARVKKADEKPEGKIGSRAGGVHGVGRDA